MKDQLKVFVENFPVTPWYEEWAPTIIALIALITSLISLYWNRRDYIKSTRPFVWALSYGYIDQRTGILVPSPERVGFRVSNAPSKIVEFRIRIELENQTLFSFNEKNFVKFPDSGSEWSFSIGQADFQKIFSKGQGKENQLKRIISIDYTSLDGSKIYNYNLWQQFSVEDNQWKDFNVTAD